MDTKVFGYFTSVVKHKGISRAARELGISPQGLNSAMHRLEEELGVALFDSAYGKGKLTPYGELFHRHALNMVDELAQVNRGIELLRGHDRRIIKLGCSMGIMGYIGENALDEFNEKNTAAQVLVSDELPDVECERRLLDGSYTFALLTRTTSKDLITIPIVRDYQFLWVNAKHRLAKLDHIEPADLEGQEIVSLNDDYNGTGALIRLLDAQGVNAQVKYTGEMIRVYEIARNSMALGLTCRNHVEATSESTKTVGIPIKALPWGFSLCYRRDHALSETEAAFLEYVRGKRREYE